MPSLPKKHTSVSLADGRVIQFELIGLILPKEKHLLFLQKQLVNRFILLYHNQRCLWFFLLIILYTLINNPSLPVNTFSYLLSDTHQYSSQSVAALSVNHAPIFFIIPSLFVRVNQISGIGCC